MRMFLFSDPVTIEQARAALGDLTDGLLEIGLLERREDGSVVSPFVLGVLDDLFILSDDLAHGQDAVMGFGATTIELCGAAFPGRTCSACSTSAAARAQPRSCSPSARAPWSAWTSTRAPSRSRRSTRRSTASPTPSFAPAISSRRSRARPSISSSRSRRSCPCPRRRRGHVPLRRPPRRRALAHAARPPRAAPRAQGARGALRQWPDHGVEALDLRIRKAMDTGDVSLLLLRMPHTALDEHAAAYAAGLHPRSAAPSRPRRCCAASTWSEWASAPSSPRSW